MLAETLRETLCVIDFAAAQRHYVDHLLPIWCALEPSERGEFYVARTVADHLEALGVTPTIGIGGARWRQGLVVVASYPDLKRTGGRPAALVEHGAGQDYGDQNPSNPGGTNRENVRLFLCPSESVAERNRRAYPDAAVAVVGCPKLDAWHNLEPSDARVPACKGSGHPVVAVAFHWDNTQAPESRWALPHYLEQLSTLARRYSLIGHGHPRAWGHLQSIWRSLEVEPVAQFSEVLDRADLYVCDNSSTLYEFASTGRPVLCLNAPWYRRDVSHGLRFWDHPPGLQVDEPGELEAMVALALSDPPEAREIRARGVGHAYAFVDGRAAERSAQALRQAAALVSGEDGGRQGMSNPFGTRPPRLRAVLEIPRARLSRLASSAEITMLEYRADGLPGEQRTAYLRTLDRMTDQELRREVQALVDGERGAFVSGVLGIPADG